MLRRRPVMRTVARTAVIAGTATAVAGGVSRHQQKKYAQQQEAQPAPATAPVEAPPPAAADPLDQLKELGDLRDRGVLTDAEFEAQKAKILGA